MRWDAVGAQISSPKRAYAELFIFFVAYIEKVVVPEGVTADIRELPSTQFPRFGVCSTQVNVPIHRLVF